MSLQLTRRAVLGAVAATLLPTPAGAQTPALITRPIPSSGEALPVVGLGSWVTFNVGDDPEARASCTEVMRAFFEAGGRLIDSSPMYGSSQPVIGNGLTSLGRTGDVFAADKVWTSDGDEGPSQIDASRNFWGVPRFDLLQVHNLLAWEDHLPLLFAMKAEGRLRYVGVTTSHGRRFDEIEAIMRAQPLDFIQITYNVEDREPEARILPLAQDRGMAVIANRPYQEGELIRRLLPMPLPDWAAEAGAPDWPQFLLKFIVSHPALTCAIPATTNVDHVRQNMAAATGHLPDAAMRQRMADYVASL